MDEDGEIIWGGSPRSMFGPRRTLPTVDDIIDDAFRAAEDDETGGER